jgi:hypothetical protein
MSHTIELELNREKVLANFVKSHNPSPDQMLQELIEQQLETLQQDESEIPQWHKGGLDGRMAEFQSNPEQGTLWPEVKKRLLE